MPKPKQFLKESKKKSKHGSARPQTSDEYLAAGVDFEEAGEKWRGGDAAKSTRFFVRAIDCYNEALEKFPASFDLAYNKARVQYELTQYPKLLKNLSGNLLDLLKQALESSRVALRLDPINADVLFNTAQILTSIVEAYEQSRQINEIEPLPLLEEALELFQQCLHQQEAAASEYLTQTSNVDDQDVMEDLKAGGVPITSPDSEEDDARSLSAPQDDRWATIVEPVTNDTLLDTILAQLETLTTILHFLPPNHPQALATIQSHASIVLDTKFGTYLSDLNREVEAHVVRANFLSAFADAQYRSKVITTSTYSQLLDSVYSSINLSNYPKGLVEAAESLISYNASLRLHPDATSPDLLNSRWKTLTKALEYLTAATKLSDAENVEKIHMARGDCELLRFQLGQGEEKLAAAAANAAVLLRNAEKFYRGSQAVVKGSGVEDEDMLAEGVLKEGLATRLVGPSEVFVDMTRKIDKARDIIQDAVEDGLVSLDQLKAMGL